MAFRGPALSALSYANGFTLWHYRTSDSTTDVDTSGYFNAATAMLRQGDFILANATNAGAPTSGIYAVTANTNGIVDVANMTVISGTNTD